MAIDLPPVMPPQLATQAQIAAYEQAGADNRALVADIAGIRFRVIGNQYLSDTQLQELLQQADSPSAAITELTRRYYNAGHLLVGVHYFRRDDTVTVLVQQNTLAGLRGDPGLIAHFQSLVGDDDLQLAEYDRARVLADLRAKRAGYDYRVSYEQHYDGQVILEFVPQAAVDYRVGEGVVEVNNRGSRFLGRYFAEAGGALRFGGGTEAQLSYRTALTELGEAGDGDDYHQLDIQVEHPFAWGLYGVSAGHIQYQREPRLNAQGGGDLLCQLLGLGCPGGGMDTLPLEADINRLAVHGEQILRSNPVQRWSLFQQLEYIDSEIVPETGGAALLEERYGTAEVGGRYSRRGQSAQRPSYLRAELALAAGLGGGNGSFDSDDGDAVSIGKRDADYLLLKPRLAYKLGLGGGLELAITGLGQFASERQLPQQQQFVLGGPGSLRAWLPGALIGDSGYWLSAGVERQWQARAVAVTGSVFVEHGASWYEDTDTDLGDSQSAADAGLRLVVSTEFGLESELLAALPLADDVVESEQLDRLEADFFWRLRWRF